MNGCDNRANWRSNPDKHGFRELKACLNGLGDSVRHPQIIEPQRLLAVPGAGEDGDIRSTFSN